VVFDTVKEDGVNIPELLQSVYISKHVFNVVILLQSLVPFNLLIFKFMRNCWKMTILVRNRWLCT